MFKPILFNTDMVRAILEGRKTVTRRAVKPQPKGGHSVLDYDDEAHTADILCGNGGEGGVFADWAETVKAPCWPGDILWVRETWCESLGKAGKYFYRAYAGPRDEMKEYAHSFNRWRPSIHMPREAARIFLRVTDVRVERLQEITPQQAMAEGQPRCNGSITICGGSASCLSCEGSIGNARQWFLEVWNNTIKPKDRDACGWAANPWVWVIAFERISREEAKGK